MLGFAMPPGVHETAEKSLPPENVGRIAHAAFVGRPRIHAGAPLMRECFSASGRSLDADFDLQWCCSPY